MPVCETGVHGADHGTPTLRWRVFRTGWPRAPRARTSTRRLTDGDAARQGNGACGGRLLSWCDSPVLLPCV